MREGQRNVLIAMAAIGAMVFFFRKKPEPECPEVTEADTKALARMLYAETSFNHSDPESAAVVWVALNRARKNEKSPKATVQPPGSPTWNSHPTYEARYNAADASAGWGRGLELVRKIVKCEIANPIGGRTHFVHIRGMSDCVSGKCQHKANPSRWVCEDGKCLPVWIVSRQNGGTASAPIEIGRGRFA